MIRQSCAADGAKQNSGYGGPLNPAIGADEIAGFGQLGNDAVLGGPIRGGADADQGVSEQGIDAHEDGHRSQHFHQVGGKQHAGFRIPIGQRTDPWRERDESDEKGTLQRRDVPCATAGLLEAHGDHGEQDGVVAKGGQKLRADQGEQALVHSPSAL